MKTLRYLAHLYPQQLLLLLLNSSLFIWLRVTVSNLLETSGIAEKYALYAPDWLKSLTNNSFLAFEDFLETSSWAWLVASLILIVLWRWLSRLIRFVFLLALLAIVVWLIYKAKVWQQL
ncbi:hypothetical protein ABID29_001624 [Streptococcus rupicaprae]|uniref:Sulfatase n=1 Tax=Streptococcus rupicaprae TaxID=759619 RepID=A0ABV2FIW5_9STRE